MKYEVLKRFKDKYTKVVYPVRSNYETNDADRVDELQSRGFIAAGVVTNTQVVAFPVETMLDQNANTVINSINNSKDQETLSLLLKTETEGKARKSVIQHIKKLLEGAE